MVSSYSITWYHREVVHDIIILYYMLYSVTLYHTVLHGIIIKYYMVSSYIITWCHHTVLHGITKSGLLQPVGFTCL